ncbi:MAG: division/cell wall cluster transcriptional repressor MraZ [Planctomycetaceae bacterium]
MALTGTYLRNLDEKHRLAIPKKLRDQFGNEPISSLYVCPGTEKSLALYSPGEFERLAQRLAAQSSPGRQFQNYLRLFYARSDCAQLDVQGRILIPEWLVQHAGLQKDVVMIGVHDRAEIWDRETWNEFITAQAPGFDDLAFNAPGT